MFQIGASAAALGLVLTTGTGSVDGFVALPPPAVGARSSALLQRSTNVLAVSSLADCSAHTKATTSMSLKPSNAGASGSARLPRWMLPGAAREGVGRRLSLMRRAAERDDRDEEDEEDEYEDENMEDYKDEAGLDRYERGTC